MTKKQQYNHVRVTLALTPPPPKTWTTATYHLERYTIRRNVKTVNVQLHGLRGNEKRTESISFPLLPNVADTELVRAVVFFSPNNWTVPFGMNFKQFSGGFASPLNQQLLAALMGVPRVSSPGVNHQMPVPPYAGPTGANTSVSPSFYQPPIPQPGQFQQLFPAHASSPTGSRRGMGQWYKSQSTKTKIGLWSAVIIVSLVLLSGISAAFGGNNPATPAPPSPTAQQAAVLASPTFAPTQQAAQPTATPTSTPQPTMTATPQLTANPTPTPTQPPATPTPCPGVNCNPWGYNFSAGSYITSPQSNFCAYFTCIASFWNGHGYVMECQDGDYSKSGGIQGSCSHHGGDSRPLYSH